MSKSKSLFVTILVAVLVAALDFCLWRINKLGFVILSGSLAVYGYYGLAKAFSQWRRSKDEEPLQLPEMHAEPVGVSPEFTATFDEIMAEVEAERNEAVS